MISITFGEPDPLASSETEQVRFFFQLWITGISGAFYGHYLGTIGPWDLGWSLLVTILAAMVLGGLGTLYGPILGSFILVFLNEYFRAFSLIRPSIYGILIILTLMILPDGIISLVPKIFKKINELIDRRKME